MTTHTSSDGTVYQIEPNADLQEADLQSADLRKADLQSADLRGADLRGADLRGANLQNADLGDANLRRANLRGANLQNADLQEADLEGADLQGAGLEGADLQGAGLEVANLTGADLTGADLRGANLQNADLQEADLEGADLRGANLQNANLRAAKGIGDLTQAQLSILGDGDLTGWKKCRDSVIVMLRIPADAKRSNATGRKCRAEYAEVLAVEGGAEYAVSCWDPGFAYRTGETVRPFQPFNEDWTIECGSGIHFFITRAEAEDY